MEMISARMLRMPDSAPHAVVAATTRQALVAHACDRAGGVDARQAHERTKAFYRASGQHWSLALA